MPNKKERKSKNEIGFENKEEFLKAINIDISNLRIPREEAVKASVQASAEKSFAKLLVWIGKKLEKNEPYFTIRGTIKEIGIHRTSLRRHFETLVDFRYFYCLKESGEKRYYPTNVDGKYDVEPIIIFAGKILREMGIKEAKKDD